MAGTKGYTKEKLRVVTSGTTASRQALNVSPNTVDGATHLTEGKDVTKEAEKMRDLLARLKDVTHNWPSRLPSGKMPLPLISNNHIIFAFPIGGHVIKNAVTSDGGQNFEVDGILVIQEEK